MRCLFVNPAAYDFTCHDFWMKPYGLLKLAGLLRSAGAEVHLFDFLDRFAPDVPARFQRSDPWGRGKLPAEPAPLPPALAGTPRRFKRYGRSLEAFRAFLRRVGRPEKVFLTCSTTYWYPGVLELLPLLEGSEILLGGVYATLATAHAQRLGVQVVAREDLEGFLAGLGFSFEDLLRAPPYWGAYSRLPYLVTRLSWGCGRRCTYCAVGLLEPGFRRRPVEEVLAEVLAGLRPETRHVVLYDDALLLSRQRLFALCRALRGVRELTFHCPNGVAVGAIHGETARTLRELGFAAVFLAYETSADELRRSLDGKATRGQFRAAMEALAAAGFQREQRQVYLLMGHPSLPPETVAASIREVRELGGRPCLAEYSPIPGTPDGDRLFQEEGVDPLAEPLYTNKVYRLHRWAGEETIARLKWLAHAPEPAGAGAREVRA
jgi:hypothetical protein